MCGSKSISLPASPTAVQQIFNPLDPTSLRQLDPATASAMGSAADAAYYGRSDADYNARMPGVLDATKTVGSQVASEATGGLPPIIQSELMKAGLGSALGTFGTLAPGSAALYSIGRNLGVGALNYADSRRAALDNFTKSNPERSFGLSGTDQVNLELNNEGQQNQVTVANNAGVNAVNAANVQAQNAIAQQAYAAQVQAAIAKSRSPGIGGAIGSILGGAAGFIPGVGQLIGGPLGGARIGGSIGGAFG